MKNNQKGFGALEGLLILIIIGLLGFTGYYVYHTKNNTDKTLNTAANTSTVAKSSATKYTAQEATTFTQTTYDTYLAAVIAGNASNTANPSASNQTLPQIGLTKVKDSLSSALYTKISADESTPGNDGFGCALYLPDSYKASLKTSTGSSATIGVNILSGGDINGTINVGIDLSTLKITSVTCPD